MAEKRSCKAALLRIGINDTYATIVGNQQYLREQYGLSAEKIAERIEDVING